MHLHIRQSGGASIVSIPKAILKTLNLDVGSVLDLSIEGQKIVLQPLKKADTLEDLIKGSPKSKLKLSTEDKEWLNSTHSSEEQL